MVASITTPHSIKRALNYNEKKVEQGKAHLLHAGNFLQLPQELNFYDKLNRFEKQMVLNQRAQTKTLHVSLNFHPDDNNRLTKERLIGMADEYMNRIGFGNQPYLVYQHNDAGHPHLHIVSTTIQDNGKRINTHDLGRSISAPATRQMEREYQLTPALKQNMKPEQVQEKVLSTGKIDYGKSETRRSITNVLDAVIGRYKYTSLAELNAVLQLYNITADRGKEGSRMYCNNGLQYRILDANGQKTGVPIKASLIYNKPTLSYLELKFKENELKRQPDAKRLKNAIDFALLKKYGSLNELVKALEKERISATVRRSQTGVVYGLTYIDHQTKAVFNGSDLGKEYAAKKVIERLDLQQTNEPAAEQKQEQSKQKSQIKGNDPIYRVEEISNPADGIFKGLSKAIAEILQPEESNDQLASELKEEQKRKRRKHENSQER